MDIYINPRVMIIDCPSRAKIKEKMKMKTEKKISQKKDEEEKVAEEMFKKTRLWAF